MPIRLNSPGGGAVSIDVPSTASTFTLTAPARTGNIITSADSGTVTQAMLGSNISTTGPTFYAYAGSNQTVSNGISTKLQYNTIAWNVGGFYDTTNYRFTPTVAGYYSIVLSSYGQASTALSYGQTYLFKNGAGYTTAVSPPYGGTSAISQLSSLVYLNGTTDYIEPYAVLAGTGTLTLFASGSAAYMMGFLARAA